MTRAAIPEPSSVIGSTQRAPRPSSSAVARRRGSRADGPGQWTPAKSHSGVGPRRTGLGFAAGQVGGQAGGDAPVAAPLLMPGDGDVGVVDRPVEDVEQGSEGLRPRSAAQQPGEHGVDRVLVAGGPAVDGNEVLLAVRHRGRGHVTGDPGAVAVPEPEAGRAVGHSPALEAGELGQGPVEVVRVDEVRHRPPEGVLGGVAEELGHGRVGVGQREVRPDGHDALERVLHQGLVEKARPVHHGFPSAEGGGR